MGLTSALNTSLNGLTLNETVIDVLGNNIANAGTNGFKSSKVLFATQLSRTFSVGSRPTTNSGGTNPRQVGLGGSTAAIVKNFTQGSITNSTTPSNLAIEGEGLFVLASASGTTYSRNGDFSLSSDSRLVNPQGDRVQGYAVDSDFNLVTTGLSDLRIPLGDLNIAQRTQNVKITGALLPTGTPAGRGTLLQSDALTDAVAAAPATAGSALTNLRDAGGAALFNVGDVLAFSGRKGGRSLESLSLTVAAGSTLADLTTLINDALGIHHEAGVPIDGATGLPPGVGVTADGRIQVIGNGGALNDLSVAVGDLTANGVSVPIGYQKLGASDGESASRDFVVYDSLGQQVNVKMSAVLETVTPTSTTFRWYVDSADDSRRDAAIASGTITFDGVGKVIAGGTGLFSLQRDDTAAISPMQISVDFRELSGISAATAGSTLSLSSQDGSSPGTLVDYTIDEGGGINGIFDNGVTRTLGQIALARFNNTQGLVEAGKTSYVEGVASGQPFITTPGNFGVGAIRSSAIESSNTDIGRSLVDLIVASTNYRGNARVISSVQQLVDEILLLGR